MAIETNVKLKESHIITSGRRQSKTLLTIDEHGPKSLETAFKVAICRQYGDKWQSQTLFLTFFLSTFVDGIIVFDCRLPSGVIMRYIFNVSATFCIDFITVVLRLKWITVFRF